MKPFYFFVLLFFFAGSLRAQEYSQYVNPFIGTGGHGHTYPGATLPHGMVQLSPDTRLEGWDGCSGYHYSDSFIYGFTHTHLSGTGVSDYGDVLLMPMNGTASPDNKIYGSAFSHQTEKALPGYYYVKLLDDQIDVELTTTERVGLHRYTFSNTVNTTIILDLKHRDEVLESYLTIEDSVTVTGLRRSKAWAGNQYVYFVIKFSKPIRGYGIWQNEKPVAVQNYAEGKNLKAFFHFDLKGSNTIMAKVAISAVDIKGAKKNLEAEMPAVDGATQPSGWGFDALKNKAQQIWNTELKRIEVSGGTKEEMVNFYTALYHTAIVPNINQDVDGRYRGRDNKIHTAEDFTNYSVFSLWDTYRAAHPLYALMDRKRTLDYIKTFLAQYQQGGRLPVWELAGNETDCMIGFHSVSVITDALVKGISGFNVKLALEAMLNSATWNGFGLPAFNKNGFISMEDEPENVSRTLEYAYDDWCIAAFAKYTGRADVYNDYIQKAQYYKNIFHPKSAFAQPRKNGNWFTPFDPREVNNNFTEANSWQYSFYFMQDIAGYLQLINGNKFTLAQKLDELFTASTQTTGRDQADITGLIGQYAHGNEPSHHVIYLYNFADEAFKTQELAYKIMKNFYHNAPDGLIGNEDCGQMSAWYVFSAMGFYPVLPASTQYEMGTPLFKEIKIHLENGKIFYINASKSSDTSFYLKQVRYAKENNDAAPYPHSYLSHEMLSDGGKLQFELDHIPNRNFGNNHPLTEIENSKSIVINPVINGGSQSFVEGKKVSINAAEKNPVIYFTADGSDPSLKSRRYSAPFPVRSSVTIKAIAVNPNGKISLPTTAHFVLRNNDFTVKLNTAYEPHYDGGGAIGLVDGIYGQVDWRKGNWQGYQNANLDAVIDMKVQKPVNKVTAQFLQDSKAWIIAPKAMIIYVSADGRNFKEVAKVTPQIPVEDEKIQVVNVEALLTRPFTARYVRVVAEPYGPLPAWHLSAGEPSHLFVGEINIQ